MMTRFARRKWEVVSGKWETPELLFHLPLTTHHLPADHREAAL